MVEFAMVVPLILGILAAGLELSRSLHYLQIAATLSREAASISYRECLADQPPKSQACLDHEQQRLRRLAGSVGEGIEIIISIYEFDEATGEFRRLGTSGTGQYGSKFNVVGNTMQGGIDDTVLRSHRRVSIGEVYVPYRPIIPYVGGLFGIDARGYYDATII